MVADSSERSGENADDNEHPVAESESAYSPRTRRTGGALFLLTGVLGLLLGIVLLGYAALGEFAGVPPVTIALFALPTLVVGAIQVYGGWIAWHGRRWRVAVAAGVIGLLFSPNPVLIPVKVVGLVFLGITADQFA